MDTVNNSGVSHTWHAAHWLTSNPWFSVKINTRKKGNDKLTGPNPDRVCLIYLLFTGKLTGDEDVGAAYDSNSQFLEYLRIILLNSFGARHKGFDKSCTFMDKVLVCMFDCLLFFFCFNHDTDTVTPLCTVDQPL